MYTSTVSRSSGVRHTSKWECCKQVFRCKDTPQNEKRGVQQKKCCKLLAVHFVVRVPCKNSSCKNSSCKSSSCKNSSCKSSSCKNSSCKVVLVKIVLVKVVLVKIVLVKVVLV